MTERSPDWTYQVLVVDDEEDIRELCADAMADAGYAVETAGCPADALRWIEGGKFDIVLTDLRMPGADGLTLLRTIKAQHPELDVIVMTGHGTIDTAVEALKLGAYDFVTKPFSLDDLKHRVELLTERRGLAAENRLLREQRSPAVGPAGLVGRSLAMERVYQQLSRLAARSHPVLITGESGTGKELAARALHELSPRAREPFVAVDCGAFGAGTIESELFGHRQGAFTGAVRHRSGLFAAAGKGTIFLDEIGELPLDLQVKLLRVLQEREFRPLGANDTQRLDARIVAATNRDLNAAIAEGRFREDLYYRLNVLSVALPPLRERAEDVAALAQFFVDREADPAVTGISPEALACLRRYPWPGNVRELQNHVHRAIALSAGPLIRPEDLGIDLHEAPAAAMPELEKAERDTISRVLSATGGHRLQAARQLGIGKTTMYKKMKQYGLG